MKKLFLVLGLALVFLCSTIDFSDAKSGGGSSFSGGGKSSSSSSSGGTKSSGGWSSSATPAAKAPSAPAPSSKPADSGGGWSSSSGNKAATPSDSGKSSFSAAGSGPSYSPPKSSAGGGGSWFGGSATKTYTPKYTAPPTGWTPRYYGGPAYYGGGIGGGYSFFDLWWKMELLDSISGRHERDSVIREIRSSPDYAKWKEEAARLSGENSELKGKLQTLEEENKTVIDEPEESNALETMMWFLICTLSLGIIGYSIYRIFRN